MSEEKTITKTHFRMSKTIPGDVVIVLHSITNPNLERVVRLTQRNPHQNLPLDWALSVFIDNGLYHMYKEGIFTFDDNDLLVKLAYEKGVYFGEELDFTPSKVDYSEVIFAILSSGNRASIKKAIEEHGKEKVQKVAAIRANDLTQGVIQLLESMLGIQLVLDGDRTEN